MEEKIKEEFKEVFAAIQELREHMNKRFDRVENKIDIIHEKMNEIKKSGSNKCSLF